MIQIETNNYLKELQETKKEIQIDNDWYYHDFIGDLDVFASILEKGILSKRKLAIKKNTTSSYNGLHYISVTRYSEEENSIFQLINSRPLIIIKSSIKAIKTKELKDSTLLDDLSVNTPLPFRKSCFKDEWQIYKKIPPSMFVGIYYDLLKTLKYNTLENELLYLKQIVRYLDHFNLEIPIIDGSDKRKIDKKVIRKIKI